MLRKAVSTRTKNKIFNYVQYVWVSTCVVVTIGSSAFLGYNLYNYFKYVKPIKHELEERFKQELLKEGKALNDVAQMTTRS